MRVPDEVAIEICRTQGVEKLELFSKLINNGINSSMKFLISSVFSKLFWDKEFSQKRELMVLNMKYNATSLCGLEEYYCTDKEILMCAFRYGASPIKILQLAI